MPFGGVLHTQVYSRTYVISTRLLMCYIPNNKLFRQVVLTVRVKSPVSAILSSHTRFCRIYSSTHQHMHTFTSHSQHTFGCFVGAVLNCCCFKQSVWNVSLRMDLLIFTNKTQCLHRAQPIYLRSKHMNHLLIRQKLIKSTCSSAANKKKTHWER